MSWLRSTAFGAGLTGVVLAAAGCGGGPSRDAGSHQSRDTHGYWTVREAESVAVVRGQPVHVRACRGLGEPHTAEGVRRYSRFACSAGTGQDWETFDSVAVTYVLVPRGSWTGSAAPHAFRDVRFVAVGVP